MNREQVESSNIESIGYDKDKKILEVEFTSGAIFRYTDIVKKVHNELMNAESIGSYFGRNIRYEYDYERRRGGNNHSNKKQMRANSTKKATEKEDVGPEEYGVF